MGSEDGLSLHQVRLRAWPVDKDMAHGLGGAMEQLGSSGFRVGLASVTSDYKAFVFLKTPSGLTIHCN